VDIILFNELIINLKKSGDFESITSLKINQISSKCTSIDSSWWDLS